MTLKNRKPSKQAEPRSAYSRSVPSTGYRGEVRIIAGSLKRSRLCVQGRPGLRPTPSRVRETVFDWLNHLLGGCEGRIFCDMFAGSGALGLEAASRGAKRVLAIEKDASTARVLAEDVKRLGVSDCVEVLCRDAFECIGKAKELFDVVFIDPPFASMQQMKALELVAPRLSKDGLVYLESDEEISEEALNPSIWVVLRRGKAGAVHYLLLHRVYPYNARND